MERVKDDVYYIVAEEDGDYIVNAFGLGVKSEGMGIGEERQESQSEGKVWNLLKLPFRHSTASTSNSVSSLARSLLPTRRRLKLDPSNKLYFPYEPGKQAKSAIRIKNTSKSNVAFKFQTNAPKSCFMRPPGGVLTPGESIVAIVFKFVEPPQNNEKPEKTGLKFKIMSMKVKGSIDYVPEMFGELKDQVTVEQILQVVFLDPERNSPALEKLRLHLAEANAAAEARKRAPEDAGPKILGEGLVIDEWKERRERYLAKQQGEMVMDSI
ncbi:vesicle-associated protein 4-2 isoform X1 [Vigna angularis]|uniref:vesicle-associated protein 4-2 isoform X1 n=1 Tax=Phaseolus angularis TaxID=3914 RepID=UPI0022B59D2C|nr:vesicle-associated protein 4-2 isoform X1 [Vigna angularis]